MGGAVEANISVDGSGIDLEVSGFGVNSDEMADADFVEHLRKITGEAKEAAVGGGGVRGFGTLMQRSTDGDPIRPDIPSSPILLVVP